VIPSLRRRDGGGFDAAEGAAGQRAGRFLQGAARLDPQRGPRAVEARPSERLALSRGAVRRGLLRQGRPPPAADALMVGLLILKHMHGLSDEHLCARWIENPYYQLFCGEELFQHKLTFDRSSLTRWRQRMGEERLVGLIQESLAVATRAPARRSPPTFPRSSLIRPCSPRRWPFRPTPS
jgi:Transposase domain (DUF772)